MKISKQAGGKGMGVECRSVYCRGKQRSSAVLGSTCIEQYVVGPPPVSVIVSFDRVGWVTVLLVFVSTCSDRKDVDLYKERGSQVPPE